MLPGAAWRVRTAGAEAEQAGEAGGRWDRMVSPGVAGDGRAELEEPQLMKQGLEVRAKGPWWAEIQGDGAGGILDYQGKTWEEIFAPPSVQGG